MYKGINDLLDSLQGQLSGPEARSLVRALEELDDQARSARGDLAELGLDLAEIQRAMASSNEDIRKIATLALARFGGRPARKAGSAGKPGEGAAEPREDAANAADDSPAVPPVPPVEPDATPWSDAPPDIFELIDRALERIDCDSEPIEDGLFVHVRLADGASHNVTISARDRDEDSTRVVRIAAVCGPADAGNHRNALLLNSHLIYGAIAIRQNKPGSGIWADEQYVLTETLPEREATTAALVRIISYIAEAAAKLSRQLAGGSRPGSARL